jgi:hypothetical protein
MIGRGIHQEGHALLFKLIHRRMKSVVFILDSTGMACDRDRRI